MGADRIRGKATALAVEPKQLSVLIVSEVRLLGEGLMEAFSHNGDLLISGYCSDLEETFAKVLELMPNIVLLDAAFRDGFGLVGRIWDAAPEVRVVVLALAETAEGVIAWAEAGAAGYIPRTAGLAEVVPTLVGIMRGEQPCPGSVVGALLRRLSNLPSLGNESSDAPPPASALTVRELQIIDLICAGLSNKDIARRLNIGLATTKSHVHNLLGKLNLQRRSQAALWMRERQNRPGPLRVVPDTRQTARFRA
jgi:two-component system nitrate/nitrite response regulator NarL